MLEKLEQCPLCNSGHFNNFIACKDHTVSQETFRLVACTNCGLVFTNPRPLPAQLSLYYQSKDYISHNNESNSVVNRLYKLARKFTLASKLKMVNEKAIKGNILDVGCGTGHFIEACQKDGWSVNGVEPDAKARKTAEKKTASVIKEDINEIEGIKYDVITLWHVLEHIPDLRSFMEKLKQLMKPEGTLIIAVPNYKSHDAAIYQEYWAGYDVPRHLYHFDQDTLRKLMHQYGLQVKETLPLKLDSFYVALLSEGYKGTGLMKYVKSFINGCISNIYAKNHHYNYSSLIYIIGK